MNKFVHSSRCYITACCCITEATSGNRIQGVDLLHELCLVYWREHGKAGRDRLANSFRIATLSLPDQVFNRKLAPEIEVDYGIFPTATKLAYPAASGMYPCGIAE